MTARVPYSLSVVRNERMSLKARPRSVVSLVGFCRDGGGLSGLSLLDLLRGITCGTVVQAGSRVVPCHDE